jgi:predicted ATPase
MASVERRPGNLPAETNRLVGRTAELAQLGLLLERSRLVTVSGVAGVGKTRLALRAVAELAPRFADGAGWVELSPLDDGIALPYAVAESLPLVDQTNRPMIDVVADYLADRELLLVLDTCEHIADACALTAEALLAAAPKLRILATSRCALNVSDEEILAIAPLPVPEAPRPVPDAAASPAAAGTAAGAGTAAEVLGADEEDAVTLLAERAAQAVPGFKVTRWNRADVVSLCRRLDGLPLAIELAAARLAEMPIRELADRLADRFEVLGDTDPYADDADPPWHQALRTAIGWSHQLCSPAERLAWARASVFAGSFDAETARQVCGDDRLPAEQIPALLDALADKSILTRVPMPDEAPPRLRMLDSIRDYGAFWLRNLEEERKLQRRHRDVYLDLARRGDAAWLGPEQFAWYDRMTAEHDNLRAALEFALADPEERTALELASALWFFWYTCGFPKEGQHYLERALAADPVPGPARTKALWACGFVLLAQGDADAAAAQADQCAAEAERHGDSAAAALAQALTMCAAWMLGDAQRAISLVERLRAAPRQDIPLFAAYLAKGVHGHVYVAQGNPAAAIEVLEELRAECAQNGERWMRSYADFFRAQAELASGRPLDAQIYAQAALKTKHRMHDSVGIAFAIDMLGWAAGAVGRPERAARLLGLSKQVWDTVGVPHMGVPELQAAREACERQTRQALGDQAYQAAYQSGYDTDIESGVAYALNPPTAQRV